MRTRNPLPAAGGRWLAATVAVACALAGAGAPSASAAFNGGAQAYVPGEVVVGYDAHVDAQAQAATARAVGAAPGSPDAAGTPRTRVLHVPAGDVRATVARLRRQPGVTYAAPNPIARISGGPSGTSTGAGTRTGGASANVNANTSATAAQPPASTGSSWSEQALTSVLPLPDDVGIRGFQGGLGVLQWNFFGPRGVGALEAWTNAIIAGAEGARGVRIAVLDTGVAYRDYGRLKRSPDFATTKFVAPYDFVDNRKEAIDRNGHGTHVAGTIAESTNNRIGVSGLAYGATVMPVRVLDSQGYGDAATIAKGIRYAARHNAKVINMSLEFSTSVRSSEIPDIMSAIRYANSRGAVVVGSTGNEGEAQVAYPARAGLVVSVGATTDQGCLASFSNDGIGLDIVAPGGGDNASLDADPNCLPNHRGHDIFQMTYLPGPIGRFGLPAGFDGTSMAAPHVSAAAALVIASKVMGTDPTPAQIECRLKATASPLGIASPSRIYGWGLVNAGAATSPAVPSPTCMSRSSAANPG